MIDSIKSVRKPQTVFGSVSGYYAFRNQETIWFESTLERDLLQKLEFNENVMQVISQPVEISYFTALNYLSNYTPDFLVQFYETKQYQPPLLIEVKPRERLKKDWKKLKLKLKAGFKYALDQGWDFKIFDEKRIRDQLLTNIKFLKRYKNTDFPKDETMLILDKLNQFGSHTVNGLAGSLYKSDQKTLEVIAHIWFLIEKKYISCDLTLPLKPTTDIWISDNFQERFEQGELL